MSERKHQLRADRPEHVLHFRGDVVVAWIGSERVQPDIMRTPTLGRLAYPRGDDAITLFAELNHSRPRVNDVEEPRRFQCRYAREQPHCIEQAPTLMLGGVVWPVGDDAVEGLDVLRSDVFLHSNAVRV